MNRSRLLAVATLAFAVVVPSFAQTAPDPLDRYVYPLAKPLKTPKVVIDVREVPELGPWARKAKALVEEWYPLLTQLLATEDYKPFKTIRLIFKPDHFAPASASNGEITVSGKWVKAHPDDLGMMVHELTHVVQEYPDNKVDVGWLVEGIADYTRWWRYEPESPRTPVNPATAKYTDAYRTTAAFLAWIVAKYDRRIVPALDRKLRHGEDPMPVFFQITGKGVNTLWAEYTRTLR